MTYKITMTHAARAVASKYPPGAVEAMIRSEIDALIADEDGPGSVGDLFFHASRMGEDEHPYQFVSTGKGDDELIVDTGEVERIEKIDRGPLAGKTLHMPKMPEEDA